MTNLNYNNLVPIDLLKIKNKYKELEIIFNFLDKLTIELIKISLQNENTDTIIFLNYENKKQYIVNISKANQILKHCYNEYFLKVLLKNVNNDIDIIWGKNRWSDFFSKILFVCLKNNYDRKKEIDYDFLYKSISNISLLLIDSELEKKEFFFLLNLNLRNFDLISLKKSYIPYFSLSYETFSFSKTENTRVYSRCQQYFLLERFLENKANIKIEQNEKLDKACQLIILFCFINAKFLQIKNQYDDNSYIKSSIDSKKNIPLIESSQCLHFNNL